MNETTRNICMFIYRERDHQKFNSQNRILKISQIQSKIQKNLKILMSEGLFHIEQHILENK